MILAIIPLQPPPARAIKPPFSPALLLGNTVLTLCFSTREDDPFDTITPFVISRIYFIAFALCGSPIKVFICLTIFFLAQLS